MIIGIMAEYDALPPGLGHACGHNLIAASAVGAGAALASVADDLGITVRVYGTPAEEAAAARSNSSTRRIPRPRPGDAGASRRRRRREARPFAVAHSHVEYDGVSAHAAAYPRRGVNANDASWWRRSRSGCCVSSCRPTPGCTASRPSAASHPTRSRSTPRAAGTCARTRSRNSPASRSASKRASKRGGDRLRGGDAHHHPREQAVRGVPHRRAGARRLPVQCGLARSGVRRPPRGRGAHEPGLHRHGQRVAAGARDPSLHRVDSLPYTNHQKEFAAACVGPAADRALLDAAVLMAWTAIDVTTRTQES